MSACPAAPGVAVKDKARDGFANYDKQPERDTERLRNLCQDPEYRTACGAVSQGSLSQRLTRLNLLNDILSTNKLAKPDIVA